MFSVQANTIPLVLRQPNPLTDVSRLVPFNLTVSSSDMIKYRCVARWKSTKCWWTLDAFTAVISKVERPRHFACNAVRRYGFSLVFKWIMISTIEYFVLRGCQNLRTLSLTMQTLTNGLQSCPVCTVDYVVNLVQFLLPVNCIHFCPVLNCWYVSFQSYTAIQRDQSLRSTGSALKKTSEVMVGPPTHPTCLHDKVAYWVHYT